MRVKNKVYYVSMDAGEQGKPVAIPYDSATITANIASIPEARIITNHSILPEINFRSGDELYITSKVEKRESKELLRALYHIENIIQEDLSSVYPKMISTVDSMSEDLIDKERINYVGNIYSTAYSDQNRISIGCIGIPFEYRRIKIPVLSYYSQAYSIQYRVGFLGYPATHHANLMDAAMERDPMEKFTDYMDSIERADETYMHDPKILRKFRRHRLNTYSYINYAHIGNVTKTFMTDNVKKFFEASAVTEPDILSMWNEIFDIHDLEQSFCQYPIQTSESNNEFMIIKPIYDEYDPSLCNTFFEEEISGFSYFKNEFREKTRLFMGFTLSDIGEPFPVKMYTVQADDKGNKITYDLRNYEGHPSEFLKKELEDGKSQAERSVIGSRDSFDLGRNTVEQMYEVDESKTLVPLNNLFPKLDLTDLELRKGVFPLLIKQNIHTTKKIGAIFREYINRDSGDMDRDKYGVDDIDEWAEGEPTDIGAKIIAIQKMQDSIFGERNSSIETFFAPYAIPNLSGGFVYNDTGYYGKVTGVVSTITPQSLTSSISYIRVIRGEEEILSTYYTFKKEGEGSGLLDKIPDLDVDIRKNKDVEGSNLGVTKDVYDGKKFIKKNVPQYWIGADKVKEAIKTKRKKYDSFEDLYFEKSKTMPDFNGYLGILKK